MAFASLLACAAAFAAHAEVKQSSADSFFIAFSAPVAASAMKTYGDITRIDRWWDSQHTYSGKSAHLGIKAEAGGCFCERWSGGSVEHGRVIMALPGKLLRIETALGPLQAQALEGILDFWVKSEDATTTLTLEYRVNGSSSSGLDKLAPSVNDMLGTQFERLRRYIATGNPEPSAKEKAAAAAATAAAKDAAGEADIAARVEAMKADIAGGGTAPAQPVGVAKPRSSKPKTTPQPAPEDSATPTHR